jgi:transposase InsO family protein
MKVGAVPNVLDSQRWMTREELRLAIVTLIECVYNRRRRKRRLGGMTPVEFEEVAQRQLQTQAAA